MKLADHLRRREALRAQIKALRIKEEALADGEAPAQEDVDGLASIMAELANVQATIDRLQAMITAEAADATEVGTEDPEGDVNVTTAADEERRYRGLERALGYGSPNNEPKHRNTDTGYKAARFIIGLAHMRANGAKGAADFIQRRFGDKDVAKALNTAGTATGGALIPQEFIADVIELLRATAVVRGLNPMIVPMPMGNATIPRLAGGAQAAYQGELDDINVSQETFDDVQLNAKKLTAMVPVSNDLIRRAPIGVEQLVRDDLIQVLARREDLAFLVGDGSGGTPIGLLNLCSASAKFLGAALPTDPTQANYNATVVSYAVAMLQGMVLQLQQSMSRMIRPAWVTAPAVVMFLKTLRDGVGNFIFREELNAGTLLGYPVVTTTQLPTNINTATTGAAVNNGAYLFFADFADVIIGDTLNVLVDASDVASYADGNGNAVSAFRRDQTVFRVIGEHDFNIRHQASVAVATLPGWTPLNYTPIGGAAYYVQAPSGDGSAAPSTWGPPPTGSNMPANVAANVPGGTQPGRA